MRKRVFKRREVTILHENKGPVQPRKVKRTVRGRGVKALAFAAAVSLMLGTVMTAYGEETGGREAYGVLKTVTTDIFHRHIGNPDVEGGCYTKAIAHEHQGDAAGGGGCYTRPVPHSHTGSPEDGGGCYGMEIPHTQHGPECYRTETHTHESSCISGRCTITYIAKELIETYTDTCLTHGETPHERRAAIASHSDCGKGEIDAVIEQCQSCTNALTRTHTFINCGKQEGTEQILECTKTIDGYDLTCGYVEGGAESYEPECGKNVDGYGLGCGLDEDKPCGRLILTSQAGSDDTKVIISAKVEDLSGGRLILSSEPYIWKDQEGNLLGRGESLEVEKNGDYSVTVKLENKDVDESGLHSSISVDNIHKGDSEDPSATPTASPSSSPTASPSSLPTATPEASASPAPSAHPDQTPDPSAVPENDPDTNMEEKDSDDGEDEGGDDGATDNGVDDGNIQGVGAAKETLERGAEDPMEDVDDHVVERRRPSYYEKEDQDREEAVSVSPSPKREEKIKKETTAVTVSGNNAAQDRQYRVKETKKGGFFQSAAVRILTVTVSTLLLLAGLVLLLLYLMCSVRVYNDDGEGRMVYLGRCLVQKKEEEYSLEITEAMTEKSCTNRYCIKPGFFRFGKKEDQELIVYRDDRKAVACLDKEMIVIL